MRMLSYPLKEAGVRQPNSEEKENSNKASQSKGLTPTGSFIDASSVQKNIQFGSRSDVNAQNIRISNVKH